jgi:hypothetical protein
MTRFGSGARREQLPNADKVCGLLDFISSRGGGYVLLHGIALFRDHGVCLSRCDAGNRRRGQFADIDLDQVLRDISTRLRRASRPFGQIQIVLRLAGWVKGPACPNGR